MQMLNVVQTQAVANSAVLMLALAVCKQPPPALQHRACCPACCSQEAEHHTCLQHAQIKATCCQHALAGIHSVFLFMMLQQQQAPLMVRFCA